MVISTKQHLKRGLKGLAVTACGLCCGLVPAKAGASPEGILEGVQRILFYGDSLTDGSSYPDYVVNTLNRIHPEADFELYNAAIAGDTSTHLRERLESDLLPLKPDLVIVSIGTNDALGPLRLEAYRSNLEAVIAGVRDQGGKVMLVLPSPFTDPEREARLQAHLEVLHDLARIHGLPLADVHGAFQAWIEIGAQVMGPDGIHHGPDGFECKARAIIDALGYEDELLDLELRPHPGLLLDWETSAPIPRSLDGYDPDETRQGRAATVNNWAKTFANDPKITLTA